MIPFLSFHHEILAHNKKNDKSGLDRQPTHQPPLKLLLQEDLWLSKQYSSLENVHALLTHAQLAINQLRSVSVCSMRFFMASPFIDLIL